MMRTTSLILLGLTSALVASGCDPKSESVGEAESSSGAGETDDATTGASESESDTVEPTTAGPATATSTSGPTSGATTTGGNPATTDTPTTSDDPTTGGPECDVQTCASCAAPFGNGHYCDEDGTQICVCEYAGECSIEEVTLEILSADPSAVDNGIDCGIATLQDTVEHWTQVRDCALSATGTETVFRAVFESEGIDSQVFNGYVGLTGPEFEVSDFWSDDVGGEVMIQRGVCGLIQDLDGCTIEVGEPCFSCNEEPNYADFCDSTPE